MITTSQLLQKLTGSHAVSGYEWELGMAETIQEAVGCSGTRVGNNLVYSFLKPGAPRLFISAHMDEVGFMKTKEEKRGSLIIPIGDISCSALDNNRLEFYQNNKTVVSVPVNSGESFENVFVQGLDDVPIGSVGTFEKTFRVKGDRVSSPGLDNKVGCTELVKIIQLIKKESLPCSVICCFSAKEEIGTNGVISALRATSPDLVIDIDSAYTTLDKDIPKNWLVPEMGKCPALQIMGDKFIVSDRYRRIVEGIAIKSNMSLQYEIPDIYSGGTNSSAIQSAGWDTIQINIPVAFQHSAVSQASLLDIKNTVELLKNLVMSHTLFDLT